MAAAAEPSAAPPASATDRRRVKVYECNDSGLWDDRGTGLLRLEMSDTSGLYIIVWSQNGNELILQTPVYEEIQYQRQQETLIQWTDNTNRKETIDLALSFQEQEGCVATYRRILVYQGKLSPEELEGVDDSWLLFPASHDDSILKSGKDKAGSVRVQLPEPSLETVDAIAKIVSDSAPYYSDRSALTSALLQNNFFSKLLAVVMEAESKDMTETLHTLHQLLREIVSQGDAQIFEVLFTDSNLFPLITAFEYDPEVKGRRLNHRQFLESSSKFRVVVPFRSAELEKKVHQTFRLSYFRDVVIPRLMDETLLGAVNSVIMQNNQTIVHEIMGDTQFLGDLFAALETPSKEFDVIRFLRELVALSQTLPGVVRTDLYTMLAERGLFAVLRRLVVHPARRVRLCCLDILSHMVTHDTPFVREQLMRDRSGAFLHLLAERLLGDPDFGIQEQIKEILRTLLPDGLAPSPSERDQFVSHFFDACMTTVLRPISEPDSGQYSSSVKDFALSLLAFCVAQHPIRVLHEVTQRNLLPTISSLVESREAFLALSAIRFIRTIIEAKEEHLDDAIARDNLLAPVFRVFMQNGSRYNLLNSAILELLKFVRQENRRRLVAYIAQTFRAELDSITYTSTAAQLLKCYAENSKASPGASLQSDSTDVVGAETKAVDSDEDYLNRDDGEQSTQLVEYSSDSSDDEFKLPSQFKAGSADADSSNGVDGFLHANAASPRPESSQKRVKFS